MPPTWALRFRIWISATTGCGNRPDKECGAAALRRSAPAPAAIRATLAWDQSHLELLHFFDGVADLRGLFELQIARVLVHRGCRSSKSTPACASRKSAG